MSDEVWWFHTDHPSAALRTGLGSTSLLSDSDGEAVPGSETRFLPYGEYRVEARWSRDATQPAAGLTDHGYTGQKHSDDLSLVYMKARFYVPAIGRFLSADTIVPDPRQPRNFNRYAYVLGNPIKYRDPGGNCIPGVNCPGDRGRDYIWNGVVTVGGRTTDELGEAYQYQGPDTKTCGPTNLAMILTLLLRDQGIDFQVSQRELGDLMQDASEGFGHLFGLEGYRLALLGEFARGATPPWGMELAFNEFNANLAAAGLRELGSIGYGYGGTKDDLITNLQNGDYSTLMLVYRSFPGAAHYVTVVGYESDSDEFLLLDPEKGGDRSGKPPADRITSVAWNELNENWSRPLLWLGPWHSNALIVTHPATVPSNP